MSLLKTCATCKKRKLKFFIKRRSYLFKKVSAFPITSEGELCGLCFKKIKKLVI